MRRRPSPSSGGRWELDSRQESGGRCRRQAWYREAHVGEDGGIPWEDGDEGLNTRQHVVGDGDDEAAGDGDEDLSTT